MQRRLLTLTLALLLGSATTVSGEQLQMAQDMDKAAAHGKKHSQSLTQSTHKKGAKGSHAKTLKEFHDETRPEDEGRVMEIFYNSYDHLDHSIHEVEQDMSRIKVMSQHSTRKNGRKCQPLDWVTIHWKTYVDTGHKLEDSREFKTKQPTVFEIGMYQVPKCWEITTAYMHAGQQLKVSCPSYLAYGGTPKYGHFNLDLIPADSPLVFELDVLECQPSIDKINEVNKKAGNNAPIVYRHGKRPKSTGDTAAASKKDMAKIKKKVTKMKKTISKQKKLLKQDEDETKKIESDITGSESAEQEENASKMMIKQEKVLKEEKIIKREKRQVKSVKKLIKKAENPKAAKREEDAKDKQKNPEDKPATKGKDERHTDASGKALVPSPPPFDCFYIKYPQKDAQGRELVLEADTKDKYHPKKTGLYNFFLHPLGDDEEAEDEEGEEGHHADHAKYQQWHYDTTAHKLSIKAFPDKVMFQGNNRNLVLYTDKNMKNQFFSFDAAQGVWYNEYSDQGIMIELGQELASGANIVTAPRNKMKNLERMRWAMVPCDDVAKKEAKHHGGGEDHHEEKEKEDHEEEGEHHDEDDKDEKEEKDDDHHDDGDDGDDKEEEHGEKDAKDGDEDHASKDEQDLTKAKAIVKNIVAKKKKEEEHNEAAMKAGEHHETTEKKQAVHQTTEKKSVEKKEAKKTATTAKAKKEGKKKKKEKSEEEVKKEVEKDDEEDEKLDQKIQSSTEKAAEKSDDEMSSDVEEPVKSADEDDTKKAKTSSLHQKSSKPKKHQKADKKEKAEKKKAAEKKEKEEKAKLKEIEEKIEKAAKEEKAEKEAVEDKLEKAEKKEKAELDEVADKVEKGAKKMKEEKAEKTQLSEKKAKKESKKKAKSAKKSKKQQKKAKKHKEEKAEEEETTDDIMEKFEESLGKDDLGSFGSLHQQDSAKDDDESAAEPAPKKSQVKSADADVFDHEKKMAIKKKQGLQDKKKQTQKGKEQLSEDEEDKILEKKLKELKSLVSQ